MYFALASETLRHKTAIEQILRDSGFLRKESVRKRWLLLVMVYDLLFGKHKSIQGGGAVKRIIMKHGRPCGQD